MVFTMLFAIIVIARPNTEEAIEELLPEHREYHKNKLAETYLGGPIFMEDSKTHAGGLMVMDFPDRLAAEAFLSNQPFNRAGIIDQIQIYPFEPLVVNGKVLDGGSDGSL